MGLFSKSISRNVKWEFSPKGRIFTYPAIADVNGDGILEVVVGSDDHNLYALRGSDGAVAWSFETDGPIRSSPRLADVNGDGVLEVVLGSDDSNIYCLNGVDGRVLWALRCDGPIRAPPAIGDVDCDGSTEIVVAGDDSTIYAINGRSGERNWQSSHKGARSGSLIQSAPCLVDINGDGKLEIVTGSASGYLLVFDSKGSLQIRKDFEAPSFNASVAVGDINKDGVIEIVACSDNGAVYTVRPDGETMWSKVIGVSLRSSPVLADVNGDGKMEILIHVSEGYSNDGKLLCLGPGGDILWDRTISGQGRSIPLPVDLDHDGGIEIVIISEKDGIIILSGDGEELKTIGTSGDVGAGLAVADADANTKLEFIHVSESGKVVCTESHYGSRQSQVLVAEARGNPHNTGAYRTTLQAIANLKRESKKLKELGGSPGLAYQNLLKAEREQGTRDITADLAQVQMTLACSRANMTTEKERTEILGKIKSRMKVFSSLDVDGASQLSLTVARIERVLSQGGNPDQELRAAQEMVEVLEEKSKEKLQAVNSKRLSFLVGQFLEKFQDPTDADVEGFIRYLQSEDLPFLPYEIKKAIDNRRHERKFQSLRDSGRFDFMSEEEKVIAIGSSLAESIIRDLSDALGIPIGGIQERMDEVGKDYPNVPKLVISNNGKILTDELRKTLRDIPPQKVIPAAVSLFCIYITKLFDLYQELTDFETSYSRFKTNMDYLNSSFGAEEIVSQFQEKACHGIFAEEVRVKRILDL